MRIRFTVDGEGDQHDQCVSLCLFCVAASWLRCDSIFKADDMTVQCTCSTELTGNRFSVADLISEIIVCTPYEPAVFHVTLGDGETFTVQEFVQLITKQL